MDKLDIPIINLILLSFIIGVIGQIGDLIASSIKGLWILKILVI